MSRPTPKPRGRGKPESQKVYGKERGSDSTGACYDENSRFLFTMSYVLCNEVEICVLPDSKVYSGVLEAISANKEFALAKAVEYDAVKREPLSANFTDMVFKTDDILYIRSRDTDVNAIFEDAYADNVSLIKNNSLDGENSEFRELEPYFEGDEPPSQDWRSLDDARGETMDIADMFQRTKTDFDENLSQYQTVDVPFDPSNPQNDEQRMKVKEAEQLALTIMESVVHKERYEIENRAEEDASVVRGDKSSASRSQTYQRGGGGATRDKRQSPAARTNRPTSGAQSPMESPHSMGSPSGGIKSFSDPRTNKYGGPKGADSGAFPPDSRSQKSSSPRMATTKPSTERAPPMSNPGNFKKVTAPNTSWKKLPTEEDKQKKKATFEQFAKDFKMVDRNDAASKAGATVSSPSSVEPSAAASPTSPSSKPAAPSSLPSPASSTGTAEPIASPPQETSKSKLSASNLNPDAMEFVPRGFGTMAGSVSSGSAPATPHSLTASPNSTSSAGQAGGMASLGNRQPKRATVSVNGGGNHSPSQVAQMSGPALIAAQPGSVYTQHPYQQPFLQASGGQNSSGHVMNVQNTSPLMVYPPGGGYRFIIPAGMMNHFSSGQELGGSPTQQAMYMTPQHYNQQMYAAQMQMSQGNGSYSMTPPQPQNGNQGGQGAPPSTPTTPIPIQSFYSMPLSHGPTVPSTTAGPMYPSPIPGGYHQAGAYPFGAQGSMLVVQQGQGYSQYPLAGNLMATNGSHMMHAGNGGNAAMAQQGQSVAMGNQQPSQGTPS